MATQFLPFLAFLSTFLTCLAHCETTSPILPPLPFHISEGDLLKYLGLPNSGHTHILPALYVFGDSIIDAGNNNYLETITRANYTPYGVDFGGGQPTGRCTNGRTVADFIAQLAGLPFPPPVLGMSAVEMKNTLTGVNYGSGSGRIRYASSSSSYICELSSGHVLSFQEQINLFKMTTRSIKSQFSSHESFAVYMCKSLLFIHIGSNDLGVYWQLGKKLEFHQNATKYAEKVSKKRAYLVAFWWNSSSFPSCQFMPKSLFPIWMKNNDLDM